MAITTADFKNGLTIEYEGQVYQIIYFQHVKPGKGGAFVRTTLKNLMTGATVDKTFRAGERMEQARVERRQMEFLYSAGDEYVFMDTTNYDQVTLTGEQVGDARRFLKENTPVTVTEYKGQLIGVELPPSLELKVVETDPGLRGDTASGGSKPAKLETGAVVQVPLFVGTGEVIRVDTRTGEYLERVK
ncbi:MAG: elongation factor P [Abditibacteriales bacterium]|nr:elongation factor P [Abditibacteriales bacterium]MDW8365221.1 elongation factor P [Abditibacteriales bacterium]